MAYLVAMPRPFSLVWGFMIISVSGSLGPACTLSPDLSMPVQPCVKKPCDKSGVTLTATLNATRADVPALEIEVCKNLVCARSVATLSPDTNSYACDSFGPLTASCRITPTEPGTTSQLTLHITGAAENFIDGDYYTIHVGRPGQAPLYSLEKKTVKEYSELRLTAPSCELLCRFATLE
jgi:hypothetical protein